MPATDLAAAAVSALVRALRARRRMALVRFALQANSAVALGALVPVLGFRDDYPDHFVLCRAPWANDYRRLQLPALEKVAVRPPSDPAETLPCRCNNKTACKSSLFLWMCMGLLHTTFMDDVRLDHLCLCIA